MMNDGALSQDEINALLSGGAVNEATAALVNPFTAEQTEKIEAYFKQVVEESSAIFSAMSSLDVKTALKEVIVSSKEELIANLSQEVLDVTVNFSGAVSGGHYFIVNSDDALKFGSTLVGQPLSSIDGATLSAFSELFGQITDKAVDQLLTKIGQKFDAVAPNAQVVSRGLSRIPSSHFVALVYTVTYEESSFLIYEILDEFVVAALTKPEGSELPHQAVMPDYIDKEPTVVRQGEGQTLSTKNEIPEVRGVQLPNLTAGNAPAETRNISLLMDVMMELTVELGRTRWQIKNILSMGEGTIIELDKLAGEPVDILVNHNLIARGEVVIIDENFGVRVTEIISGMDKLSERH